MLIFTLIIPIISFLIGAYISYYIFKNHGFKVAWAVNAVIQLVSAIFQNGMKFIFASIVGVAIGSLIGTAIEYFVYQKTNSCWRNVATWGCDCYRFCYHRDFDCW